MNGKKDLEVKVNLHGNEPMQKHGDWTDLCITETVKLEPLEFRKISLGISMEIPEGWYAEVLPRSSTFERYGIIMTNSMGIIDNSYCGDNDVWMMPVLATRPILIKAGTRIAQFRLVEHGPNVRFTFVENLGNPDRGGFGSSGV